MIYLVHTRQSIQAIDPKGPHIIVSITDRPDTRPKLPINRQCLGAHLMTFHDVVRTDYDPKLITPFNRKMANELLDFWLAHRDTAEVAYIHCDGGQCRSPGVAAALQRLETGNDQRWFDTKRPNILVYRLILDEGYARNLHSV